MTVVQFPGRRRQVPAAAPVDVLLEELAGLEVKLARARLAQINQETRQAAAVWGWYCFKRCLVWGVLLWAAVSCAKAADVKRFYNANGSPAGTSITRGNSGQYYDGAGRFSGSSLKSGSSTLYFDHQGRFSGSTSEPRR